MGAGGGEARRRRRRWLRHHLSIPGRSALPSFCARHTSRVCRPAVLHMRYRGAEVWVRVGGAGAHGLPFKRSASSPPWCDGKRMARARRRSVRRARFFGGASPATSAPGPQGAACSFPAACVVWVHKRDSSTGCSRCCMQVWLSLQSASCRQGWQRIPSDAIRVEFLVQALAKVLVGTFFSARNNVVNLRPRRRPAIMHRGQETDGVQRRWEALGVRGRCRGTARRRVL